LSWFSQKLKNHTLSDITWDSAARAIPVVGDAIANEVRGHKIESTISSARHIATVGYDMVRREAQATGTSEWEALQNLIKRTDASFTGLRFVQKNSGVIFAVVIGLALLLLMRRK
jgi:hypothetical protein